MALRNHLHAWIVLLSLAVGCGGGGDSAPSVDEGENTVDASADAVLTERAVVLDEATLAALRSFNVYEEPLIGASWPIDARFEGPTAQLRALEEGDVLIFGVTEQTPNGALIVVESVVRMEDEFMLEARRAELGDAFAELSVQLEAELGRPAEAPGLTVQPLGPAFPFSFEGSDNASELSGSLSVDSSIGLELDFSFEDGLSELSIRLAASETFRADLVAAGAASFEDEVELGTINFAPITIIVPIPIAPGTLPVILTPQVVLEAMVSGSVQGQLEASVRQDAMFEASLGFQDGDFGGESDSDSMFSFDPPAYEAAANLRVSAGPRLEVLLYGAVGPYVSASAFAELSAQVEGPPPCVTGALNAGVSSRAGVQVLADYETTFPEVREQLASFDSCDEDPDPNAPQPATTWARTFARDGSPGETARAVIEASDGSFVVLGQSGLYDDVTGFAASSWVLRLDPLGNVLWQRAYRREALGLMRGLTEVPGGYLLVGASGAMLLDTGGTPRWAKRYTAGGPLEIASVAAQRDGRFVVVGYTGTPVTAWAMGLDAGGDVEWSRSFTGDDAGRVRATEDGGYVVIGKVSAAFDISVLKLDAAGELEWARTVDNLFDPNPEEGDDIATSDDRAFDIAEKPGGGYVIAGEAYGNFPLPEPTPVGYYGTWVVELDADGELGEAGSVTHRAPIDALYGGAYAVAVQPNGTTVLVGRSAREASDLLTSEDILVLQGGTYSSLGGAGHDSVDTTLSGNGRGMPFSITADGGFILAATSDSFDDREQIWLLKLNRTGGINIPERENLRGASFVNGHATSTAFEPSPADVEVTAEDVTAEVDWESTAVLTRLQAP